MVLRILCGTLSVFIRENIIVTTNVARNVLFPKKMCKRLNLVCWNGTQTGQSHDYTCFYNDNQHITMNLTFDWSYCTWNYPTNQWRTGIRWLSDDKTAVVRLIFTVLYTINPLFPAYKSARFCYQVIYFSGLLYSPSTVLSSFLLL